MNLSVCSVSTAPYPSQLSSLSTFMLAWTGCVTSTALSPHWCKIQTSLTCTHTLLQLFLLTAVSPSSLSYLPSTYTHPCTVVRMCIRVYLSNACVCKQWRAVFHSWIKPGQPPQDCRLMWPISSDYSCMVTASPTHTHIHTHASCYKDESQ